MDNHQTYYDDEIDLREIFQTLLKGWKIILLLTALAGAAAFGFSALQTPVYEANAVVSIDKSALSLPSSPASMLLSDDAQEAAAGALDVPRASLPQPEIAADKTDKNLFTITVQSSDARFAAQVANAWANAGIALISEALLTEAETALTEAETALTEADGNFVAYLEQHGLSQWTWADLSALTGVNWRSNGGVQRDTQALPPVSADERLQIAQLMWERIFFAEQLYAARIDRAKMPLSAAETPVKQEEIAAVVNASTPPAEPVSQKVTQNTALGIAAGLMLGVFWVFAAAWWRKDDAEAA